MRGVLRLGWLFAALLMATPAHAQDPPLDDEAILPAHVLASARSLRRELRDLAARLDLPPAPSGTVDSDGAQPREVYFQARGLYRLVNRVAFQRTSRDAPALPLPPDSTIRPADVRGVVETTRQRLDLLRADLGLGEAPAEPAPPRSTRPDEVYEALTDCIAIADTLLEQRVGATELHHGLSRSVVAAAQLLALFPGAVRIPPEPPPDASSTAESNRVALAELHASLDPLLAVVGETRGALTARHPGRDTDLAHVHAIEAELVWLLLHANPAAELSEPLRPPPVSEPELAQRLGLLAAQLRLLTRLAQADGAALRGE